MSGGLRAAIGHVHEHVSEPAAQASRPLAAAHFQRRFQRFGQFLRWRVVGGTEGAADQLRGLLHQVFGNDLDGPPGRLRLPAQRFVGRGDNFASIEFQSPAVAAVVRDAVQLQRADGRGAGGERDRHLLRPGAPLAAAEHRRQRRQLQQLVRRHVQDLPRPIIADGGRKQWKQHRLAERQLQLGLGQDDLLVLLHVPRDQAQNRHPGCGFALDADVIRPRDAAADPPAAGVPQPGIRRRPPSDRQVQRWRGQHDRPPAGPVPGRHDLNQPLSQRRRLKHAAIKQDRVEPARTPAGICRRKNAAKCRVTAGS